MKSLGSWAMAAAAATFLLFTAPVRADARPSCSKDGSKPIRLFPAGEASDLARADSGTVSGAHPARKGSAEQAKAPAAKAADEPVAAPTRLAAATPGTEAEQDAGDSEKTGDLGCCGCPCCKKRGHRHGEGGMPPMMERMKAHLEEMKKAAASLRESEKAVEGAADLEALRQAVLSHLKRIDDLQESHLRHMESMMEARHGGMRGHPHHSCW